LQNNLFQIPIPEPNSQLFLELWTQNAERVEGFCVFIKKFKLGNFQKMKKISQRCLPPPRNDLVFTCLSTLSSIMTMTSLFNVLKCSFCLKCTKMWCLFYKSIECWAWTTSFTLKILQWGQKKLGYVDVRQEFIKFDYKHIFKNPGLIVEGTQKAALYFRNPSQLNLHPM